jgi:hypothetical protein
MLTPISEDLALAAKTRSTRSRRRTALALAAEDRSAMMSRMPKELKIMILDNFSMMELLVMAQVSTEVAELVKYTFEKNFTGVWFDD